MQAARQDHATLTAAESAKQKVLKSTRTVCADCQSPRPSSSANPTISNPLGSRSVSSVGTPSYIAFHSVEPLYVIG